MAIGAAPMLGAAELLDLNTATVKQLAALPELGAERAKMIVRVRERSGPFRTLEGLLALPRLTPNFHFSFGSANHRVASDAFIDEGWKALKALRRSTPHG